MRDLDFEDDDSYITTANRVTWTTGTGWPTILTNGFFATLEGNGHTISNLFVNKSVSSFTRNLGFMGDLGSSYHIRNLGLSNVNFAVTVNNPSGAFPRGVLLSTNNGTVTNCYVQGRLEYKFLRSGSTMASLVGLNANGAKVSNSYVNIDLSENMNTMGGFFIDSNRGAISNSYSIGDASKVKSVRNTQISFISENLREIKNIYHAVSGSYTGSPLVDRGRGTEIINSYWDSTKWGGSDSKPAANKVENVDGFTTIELQQATASTDTTQPYYEWSENNWDFGNHIEYPALKYATACGASQQPKCGTLLRGQRKENLPPTISGQNDTRIPDIGLLEGASTTLNVIVKDADDDSLSVSLDSSDSTVAEATIIAASGANRVIKITTAKAGKAGITVTANDGLERANSITSATFTVTVEANEAPTLEVPDMPVTVKAGEDQTFNVTVSDENFDANDSVNLTVMSSPSAVLSVTPPSISDIVIALPVTFTLTGLVAGDAMITITATDSGELSNSKILSARVNDNIPPTLTIPSDLRLLEGTSKTLVVMATDADDDFADLTVDVMSGDTTTATATLGALDGSDYPLVITAKKAGIVPITVSVDDGNSRATKTFEVTIVENQAPTLEIVTSPSPTIELDTTTSVVISMSDENFNLNDSVTLEAVSSPRDGVLVSPARVSDIGSNTIQTFILTGERVGESNISFTATDINGGRNTVSVLLSVFSSLATSTVTTVIATIGKALNPTVDTSTFFTHSGRNPLSYTATGLPTGLSISTMTGVISGTLPNNAAPSTDTDEISVVVTADDGRGGSAPAMFTLLINAEPSGTVTISPSNRNKWLLEADTSGVSDANGIDATKTSYQWFRGNAKVGTNSDTYPIKDNKEERAIGTKYKVDVKFVDDIGQSATTSSNVYKVENLAPTLDAISHDPVKEGEDILIIAMARDENHDELNYEWSISSDGNTRSISPETDKRRLSFKVPSNWIIDTADPNKEVTLQLEVKVTEKEGEGLSTTRTASVVVTKEDNDTVETPSISVDTNNVNLFTFGEIVLMQDDDGVNGSPNLNYQWQRCLAGADCSMESNWQNVGSLITDITNRSLTIPNTPVNLREEGNGFRVQILYTDGQGYRRENFYSGLRGYSVNPAVKVRAKVFLEGPLQ